MQLLVKIIITTIVVISCTFIGKKWPTLGGLIATMPLTALLVMLWLHLESRGDLSLMRKYSLGALWGILPSLAFFISAYLCYKKNLSLLVVLVISFSIWLMGAFLHQKFLPR